MPPRIAGLCAWRTFPLAANHYTITKMLFVDMAKRRGRPFLSEEDRRTDLYCVRLNNGERRRLYRLSGVLAARLADVFREGLLALEERERHKEQAAEAPRAPPPLRSPK